MWMRTERGKRTDMEMRNITMDEHIQEAEDHTDQKEVDHLRKRSIARKGKNNGRHIKS